MSSLIGVFDPSQSLPTEEELRFALNLMKRRGSDQIFIHQDQSVAMAVAVFDPSDDGRYPGVVQNLETGLCLFLDGIIDGIDLTGPDGQSLLRDFDDSPDETLARLHGDFALAFWSPKHSQLLLARDHLGTRPLLAARQGSKLLFGSRPRALASIGLDVKPDPQALAMVLQLGIMPAPWSGWRGIERLRPGERMIITPSGVEKKYYWTLNLTPEDDKDEVYYIRQLRHALETTVAEQMDGVADPIFCMSGGVDSTAVAALGRRILDRKIQTVCLGFSGSRGDDRPFARRAAKFLDTRHHEIEVTAEMLEESLDEIAEVLEIPSLLSYTEFFLTRALSGNTRLLITGETADSQFGGTSPFMMLCWLTSYQRIPQIFRRGMARVLTRILPESLRILGKHPIHVLGLLHEWDRGNAADRYLRIRSIFSRDECCDILHDGQIRPDDARSYIQEIMTPYEDRPMDAMIAGHILHEAPNEYLADDYKFAGPLVYRSPYASRRVADVAAAIPSFLKVRKGIRKYILIEAVKEFLPPETLTRPKMGFALPMAEWLAGPLRSQMESALSRDFLPPFLNPDPVTREVQNFLAAPDRVNFRRVWLLMTLSLWAKSQFNRG